MAKREVLNIQWQQRLQAWRDSGLNQKQWCEQHEIRQPQFWYWKKKLQVASVAAPGKDRTPAGFVPVVLEQKALEQTSVVPVDPPTSIEPSPLTVSLPNGLTVSGIGHGNFVLAGQLIGLLQ